MAPKWVQNSLNSRQKLLSRKRVGVKVQQFVQNGPANFKNPKNGRNKSLRRSKDSPRDVKWRRNCSKGLRKWSQNWQKNQLKNDEAIDAGILHDFLSIFCCFFEVLSSICWGTLVSFWKSMLWRSECGEATKINKSQWKNNDFWWFAICA